MTDAELVARGFTIAFNAVVGVGCFCIAMKRGGEGYAKGSLVGFVFAIANVAAAVANTLYVLSRLVAS